jgi:RHS repeat-associated protein
LLWNSELVSKFGYTLDSQGRKIHADETFNVSGAEKTNKIDWTYDTAGRLIQEVFNHYDDTLDQTQEWEYDLVGNRTLQKLDKGNDGIWEAFTTYDYDVNDRLLTEIFDDLTAANKDRITEYRYDHTQQTYKSVSENGAKLNETTFEYDAQGRMEIVTIVTFAEDGTKTRIERTSYDYNTDGIRVSALHEIDSDADGNFETSKLTEYLNDPLNITGYSQVLKQTETDLVTGEQANITYIIGRSRISQITVKDNTEQELYFTFDGHGSTRVLTDLAGAIVELYAFDAYGNAIGFDPSVALTEFLYSGEQFDSKIGQQYLRARYYDPTTGRFNRLDPFFGNLTDPQSLHKYLYTHADPVNGIDPSGLMFGGSLGMAIANTLGAGMRLAVAHPIITSTIIAGTLIGAGWGAYNYGWRGAIGYGILGGGSAAAMAAIIAAQPGAGSILLGILTLGYFGEWISNGLPAYPKSEVHKEKIKAAIDLIKNTPGYGKSYIPTTILISKKMKDSGLSPYLAPLSIYLREDILDLPTEFVASTIVHEARHQWQGINKFNLAAWGSFYQAEYLEFSPYQIQSNFLRQIFKNKTGNEILTIELIQNNFPSDTENYNNYLVDLKDSFQTVKSFGGKSIDKPAIVDNLN